MVLVADGFEGMFSLVLSRGGAGEENLKVLR